MDLAYPCDQLVKSSRVDGFGGFINVDLSSTSYGLKFSGNVCKAWPQSMILVKMHKNLQQKVIPLFCLHKAATGRRVSRPSLALSVSGISYGHN